MDLVDRKAVLEAIRLGMTVTQLERAIAAIPTYNEGWEDRSAIQGTNPGLAELIKANQEIERLQKYIVRQHDHFTGKDVPDLIVTTGTDYEA
jgi:hypothetical protein